MLQDSTPDGGSWSGAFGGGATLLADCLLIFQLLRCINVSSRSRIVQNRAMSQFLKYA